MQNSPVSGCCVRVLSACGPAWERRLGVLLWLASLGLNPVVLTGFPFQIFSFISPSGAFPRSANTAVPGFSSFLSPRLNKLITGSQPDPEWLWPSTHTHKQA